MRLRMLLGLSLLTTSVTSFAQIDWSGSLKWREVGPARGGRSVAVSGVVGKPTDFYMGTCGGGLWKSTNAGVDWTNVSDGYFQTQSIGAIAVSESNPDIVFVGTGECDIRGNITHGDGVYKSIDGGKTWINVGLRETKYIGKVRVDPKNPDIVLVAALGHVYGPNKERGIYKTSDGGKTWRQVIFVDEKSGGIDVEIDPNDSHVIFASTWEAWRTPFMLNSGGAGSKLFKSVDGGETWKDISANKGLPAGILGKIRIAISAANSKRVWASVEAAEGGIFRSEDAGETWSRINDENEWRQRAWYFSHVVADPKDADVVYDLNVEFGRSKDGGKTFSNINLPHGDNHDLWIDPHDPKRMIEANDGGGTVTVDGGKTWTDLDFPTAQIYHVVADNAFPYRLLGAQQDNSTVRIPSRSEGGFGRGRGPDWTSTAGGESGYIAVKPDNPDVVYGGSYGGDLSMQNHRTGESRAVDPWPDNPMGHGAIDLKHRFQWTYPIVFSPHGNNTLYTCSQYVLRSTNGGKSWSQISPDLTRNDPKTLQSSGGPLTKDNTSVEYYGTIFTIAESPKKRGLIWAGSDDGLVHVTSDGGKHWLDVTPKEMPHWGLCSIIEASPSDPAEALLAVDNHENDDHVPYIYRTNDLGKTWKLITRGLPRDVFVRSVREDPKKPGLLFCATETGVHVSFDDGENWTALQLNLPNVPVHDLIIKDDDLCVATHGRSFWILDDITPLREYADVLKAKGDFVFKPKDAIAVRFPRVPSGLLLDYYLVAKSDVNIEVLDSTGFVVAKREDKDLTPGLHRQSFASLSYPSYKGFPGMVFWGAFSSPIAAPPGEYTVKLSANGKTFSHKVRWLKDPRHSATDKELVEQTRFCREIAARVTEANNAVILIRSEKKRLDAVVEAKKLAQAEADRWKEKLTLIEESIHQTKIKAGEDPLNFPIRINNKLAALLGIVQGSDFGPTDQSYKVYDELSKALQVQLDALKKIEAELPK